MSGVARRVLSVLVVAVVVAVGVVVYRSGGDDDTPSRSTRTPQQHTSDVVVDSTELRALKARAGIATCAPGTATSSALPAVTLPCLGGGPAVDLAGLKGPMLLSFWQAGCGPCRQEIPALEAFSQRYGTQVPVLGVDFLDTVPGSALQLMQRRGGTYPSVADPGGELQATSQFAKISGLPTLYFVDARGRIAYAHAGGVDSEAAVADLVREHLGVDL